MLLNADALPFWVEERRVHDRCGYFVRDRNDGQRGPDFRMLHRHVTKPDNFIQRRAIGGKGRFAGRFAVDFDRCSRGDDYGLAVDFVTNQLSINTLLLDCKHGVAAKA